MTPSQEKEFVDGFTGQGDVDTDSASHIPASGKGAPVEAPDVGKNPSAGYESSAAEDFGHVVEAETGNKAPAQALDYGQEGERPSQGEGATNSSDAASDNRRNTKVHAGRQEKHIEGSNNYREGSSKFYGTAEDAQRLIDKYSGTGSPAGVNKERINFGVIIGEYFDPETQKSVETTMGIIHYSKTGAHIVPARPID